MTSPTRRTVLKTFGMTIGATCESISLPVSAGLFANNESKQPIRLGVIADLHGGLAVDADMRLDAFLQAMHKECFEDTFRQSNPDILDSTLGHTWTTVGTGYQYVSGKGVVPVKVHPQPEYRDPYARIDYIYAIGSRLEAINSQVIRHHRSQSERSFPEFLSDHAAVLTEFQLRRQ